MRRDADVAALVEAVLAAEEARREAMRDLLQALAAQQARVER